MSPQTLGIGISREENNTVSDEFNVSAKLLFLIRKQLRLG